MALPPPPPPPPRATWLQSPESSLPPPPPPPARWGIGDALLIIPILFAVVIPVTIASAVAGIDDTGVVALGLTAQAATFLAWPIIVSRTKGTGSPATDFGLRAKLPADIGIGLLGGFVAMVAAGIVGGFLQLLLDPEGETTNTSIVDDAEGSAWLLLIAVTTAVVVPVAEELLFRGLLLRALAKRWSVPVGAVVSGLVFTLVHAQFNGFAEDVVLLGSIAAYTVVLTSLVVRTGRLGPAVVAHAAINTVGVLGSLA